MKSKILAYIPSETKDASHLSMQRILGIPLFLRGILTLAEAGHKSFMIVAPQSERRVIIKAWEHHAKRHGITPHFIWTGNDQLIDSNAFADILGHSDNTVYLLNANLLITKHALDKWENIDLKKGQHLKAVVDRGLPPLVGVTRADLERIRDKFKGEPVSIEDITKEVFIAAPSRAPSSEFTEASMLVTRFTPKSEVTRFLTELIRMATGGWVARVINKRISLPLSVILCKMNMSPNVITVINMIIGMSAAIGAAGRTYTGLLIGAALFQTASILDGCDGEVAKLTFRTSKFGQYIDSVSDNLSLAGFLTGLMIHVYRVNNHTPWAFVWGSAVLLGVFTIIGIMTVFLKKNTNSASFVTYDKEFLQKLPSTMPKGLRLFVKYGKIIFKKDSFSLAFLIFAIFGILPAWLYIAAIGTWGCVAVMIYLNLLPKRVQ